MINSGQEKFHFDRVYEGCTGHQIDCEQLYRSKLGWFSGEDYFAERGHQYKKAFELIGIDEPFQIRPYLSGKKLLDYGCGHGVLSVFFAKLGAHVTGIDISESSIKCSKEFAAINGVETRCQFLRLDAADMNFLEDSSFDLIFCDAALHHTIKYDGTIAELYRVLKKDGRVITLDPVGRNFILEIGRFFLRSTLYRGQGEYVLKARDFRELAAYFKVKVYYFSMFYMLKRLFRGKISRTQAGRHILVALWNLDNWLLSRFPRLNFLCGECVLQLTKS